MKYAIVQNGVVVNLAKAGVPLNNNWIAFDGAVNIGDIWDGNSFIAATAPEPTREQRKVEREAAVSAIKVTTSGGKIFDGDEVSQGRMARAILALQATGTPSTVWVLADNTPTQATVAELSEALALAGAEQARLWVLE